MIGSNRELIDVIHAAETISKYCRNHVCTECPLNLNKWSEGVLKAHCVCDYNILRLPSTWKIDELKNKNKKILDGGDRE